MKTLNKGQNIDFILATHEDDAGALSRVSAISSSFPLARIIVVDSSSATYKSQSRLASTLKTLGTQASYVDCNTPCRYSCYQKAMASLQGDYVAFRTHHQLMDETLTALGVSTSEPAEMFVTHPEDETQQSVAGLEAIVFHRSFVEQNNPFSEPANFDEKKFVDTALSAARRASTAVAA